ncbi:MAG TPA: hypothetical protein VMM38_01410 [Aridibacter sp.]|nr:hypothetical protein [Aridibacter sp.]
MARPVQKKIRELLDDYAKVSNTLADLSAKRDAANLPAKEKYEAAVKKHDKKFAARIDGAKSRKTELEAEIKAELQKGYDTKDDNYSLTKVETDAAAVEINTSEQREVSPEDWLREVPGPDQRADFWDTLKVMIGKAEKFRSDLVEKLADKKRSHNFSFRLK